MRKAIIDLDTGEILEYLPKEGAIYTPTKFSKLFNDGNLKQTIKYLSSLNALKLWLLMVVTMQQENKPTVAIEELAEQASIHKKNIPSTITKLKEVGLITTNSLNELIPNPLYAWNGSQAQQYNSMWTGLFNSMEAA